MIVLLSVENCLVRINEREKVRYSICSFYNVGVYYLVSRLDHVPKFLLCVNVVDFVVGFVLVSVKSVYLCQVFLLHSPKVSANLKLIFLWQLKSFDILLSIHSGRNAIILNVKEFFNINNPGCSLSDQEW